MRRFLLLVSFAVLSACSTPPALERTPLFATPVFGTPEPTLNRCMVCGSQAMTMTARVPATQTAAVMHMTQTAIAPVVQATLTAAAEPSATPTFEITEVSEACTASPVCYLDGHFLFQRPVPLTGPHSIERSYPYGSTQDGKREVHHGVEFYNAQGTPVLAAAAGEVVFAGDDALPLPPGEGRGAGGPLAWVPAFYGNVIVLEHWLGGETFFTLYGHLYSVGVSAGQRVAAGEQIGEVGASGTAIGSHLHFEIRRGSNDYFSTRNPELWLAPPDGTGVLAGRIVDGRGNPVKGLVNVQRMENGTFNPLSVGSAATYAPTGVNGDDVLQETFALGEIPAGEYRLSLVHYGIVYEQVVKIEAGRLTFVNFLVK
jgi:murein DD-endopeptidase MepM/ murein hydrolase activator NlpD